MKSDEDRRPLAIQGHAPQSRWPQPHELRRCEAQELETRGAAELKLQILRQKDWKDMQNVLKDD